MERYRVKVLAKTTRERTYLWGGNDIRREVEEATLTVPVLLNLRVDELGERIAFGVHTRDTSFDFGMLNPSESFTISLDGLFQVWAESELDTYVDCYLYVPSIVRG